MRIILGLGTLALRGIAIGSGVESGEVIGLLRRQFDDHSQKMNEALQRAADRSWRALEVALAGPSLWDRLANADERAFRQ